MPSKSTTINDLIFELANNLAPFDALRIDGDQITLIQRQKVQIDGLPAALGKAKKGDQIEVTRNADGRFLVEITRVITMPPPGATG